MENTLENAVKSYKDYVKNDNQNMVEIYHVEAGGRNYSYVQKNTYDIVFNAFFFNELKKVNLQHTAINQELVFTLDEEDFLKFKKELADFDIKVDYLIKNNF